jgi:hypothetical protein
MTGPVGSGHHRRKAPRIKWSATISAQHYKPRGSALVSSREPSGKCALNARSKPCPGWLSKPTGAFFAAIRLLRKHPSAVALQALAIH